jgi:uncharacterized membrane protein
VTATNALVTAMMGATLVACFTSGPSCTPGDLPTCTVPPPSYATTVAPIVAAQCTPCHSLGGVESKTPLVTVADVQKYAGSVLDQVDACLMPQGSVLTDADRRTLLTWLVCGAPNN